MNKTLLCSKRILFVLSFLVCTVTFINGHPNAFSFSESSWTPEGSEDDVSSRSLSYEDITPSEEMEDLDTEYSLDDVEDDLDDFDEYNFLTNNKRNPNSRADKSFRNFANYYMVVNSKGAVVGTKDLSKCMQSGIFEVGRTPTGKPFYWNKKSRKYLAIDPNGNVYMSPTQNSDTVIYTINDSKDLSIYLYRIVGQNQRLYLDLSPQSSTVGPGNTRNTTKFRSRNGLKTC
ncbi:hypothetical protein AWC38_SpisGene8308 [Stylophora pistillata]|uniref:Uncharacterized protein n=1 Tax=Stylophora pistillata TaxID=50429 RepID=A0A2B4SCA4_STYPI|nr:hypothetical protein AWC38_SpisGene8308 [Stylophora pistillata]